MQTVPAPIWTRPPQGNVQTGVIVAAVLLTVFTLGYCLPLAVAMCRRCEKTGGIACVNILTGWTVIGWIAALIWAFVDNPQGAGPGSAAVPGWYAEGNNGLRYWNGAAWTEWTQPQFAANAPAILRCETKEDAARRLAAAGRDVRDIADIVALPQQDVRDILSTSDQ
jgi:hypothetical protein